MLSDDAHNYAASIWARMVREPLTGKFDQIQVARAMGFQVCGYSDEFGVMVRDQSGRGYPLIHAHL